MKISIITPSLNQAKYLEKNILSVLNQDYDDFEHIVIDGGSTDGSIEILKKFKHLRWISEKDNGQAQAINKGFKLAKGDIIGWLNSDDLYSPGVFQKINNIFSEDEKVDFIFSHCMRVDENDNVVGFSQVKDPEEFDVLSYPNFIPQPTVFFRNIVFRETGYLNEEYFLAMDVDYWRRISKHHKMRLIKDIFAYFRLHNESKTTKYLKYFKYESKRSFFKNGGSVYSAFYFETFIKPVLMSLFVYNPITKRIFFNGKK
jgi:glycosyltransferase involved in cell wall biosynthesis